jgi:hypothetical protein
MAVTSFAMLAAQSEAENIPIATNDPKLRAFGIDVVG